jgi:hypothetical protein
MYNYYMLTNFFLKENSVTWKKVMPIVLLCIRIAPRSVLQLNSYGITYGRPFQTSIKMMYPTHLEFRNKIKHFIQ